MIKELIRDTEILSTPCEPATADDAQLAADLVETLEDMGDAACLAANQIGVTKSVVAVRDGNDKVFAMFNPKLKKALGPEKLIEECLTLDGETKVTRYARITATYQELVDGELVARSKQFDGWEAQIVQHMIDHCKGKLI